MMVLFTCEVHRHDKMDEILATLVTATKADNLHLLCLIIPPMLEEYKQFISFL